MPALTQPTPVLPHLSEVEQLQLINDLEQQLFELRSTLFHYLQHDGGGMRQDVFQARRARDILVGMLATPMPVVPWHKSKTAPETKD